MTSTSDRDDAGESFTPAELIQALMRPSSTSSERAASSDGFHPTIRGELPPPWARSSSSEAFVNQRGQHLARYCRALAVDPLSLTRAQIAEALGYASDEAFRNAMHVKGVTAKHIQAEAYRLLNRETR